MGRRVEIVVINLLYERIVPYMPFSVGSISMQVVFHPVCSRARQISGEANKSCGKLSERYV